MKKLSLVLVFFFCTSFSFSQSINSHNGVPDPTTSGWGSQTSALNIFYPDKWLSGTVSGTTPVTILTAPAGMYYHICIFRIDPSPNIAIAATGGQISITIKDSAATIPWAIPSINVPLTSLTSLLLSQPWVASLGPNGYPSAAAADNFSITLGTAPTTGSVSYTVGYCVNEKPW